MNNGAGIDRIAITGIGLVTSLGLSAPTSLAAIRSGIANFSRHETVLVNGNAYGNELSRAKIARLPEHAVRRQLHGADRAVALLVPAIRECTDGLPDALLKRALWRLDASMKPENGNLLDLLKVAIADLPASAMQANDAVDSGLGRCLFFENIMQAAADLRNGTAPMVVVGCVDSLCDDPILNKLFDADLLKSGTNPEGIVAGEAAGVLLLELESQAIRRNAGVLAYIAASGRGVEPQPWTRNTSSTAGRGLINAFKEAFTLLSGKGEEIDMVIADLNGELQRAREWAVTAPRIFPIDDRVRGLEHPADCTGDCGAAMGGVLVATAIDIMSGPSAPANIALATSDEGGARRILCLQRGNTDIDAVVYKGRKESSAVVAAVIEQHCDDASFLWLNHQRLAKAPQTPLEDLKRNDARLKANLDGIYRAGEAGWELSQKALTHGDEGDYFVASYIAFKSGDADRIDSVLVNAGSDRELYDAIASALGWLSYEEAEPHIKAFLAAEPPLHRYIGIAASAIHRRDPEQNHEEDDGRGCSVPPPQPSPSGGGSYTITARVALIPDPNSSSTMPLTIPNRY